MKVSSKTRSLFLPKATPIQLMPRLLLAALFFLTNMLQSPAQNVVLTGAIGGRVTDQSGAVVPGASVVVRNLATGVEQSAETNHAGLYRFPVLMPGTYSITASLKGFRDVQALVQVRVGNTTSQDIKLQVGASGDTVKVIGTTPLLRPEESSASTVIDRSLIEELPLNGRRYTDFTVLTPNTSYDGDTGLVSIAGQQGGEDSGYANGNGSNAFTVDGSNATNNYFADIIGRYRIPYLYGEDAIQEFQVVGEPVLGDLWRWSGLRQCGDPVGEQRVPRQRVLLQPELRDRSQRRPRQSQPAFRSREDALQQFGAGVGGPIVRNRLMVLRGL